MNVPPEFEPLFKVAEQHVARYFQSLVRDPAKGIIEASGERFILIRGAALSIEFFDIIQRLFAREGAQKAMAVANQILFDIGHALGKADAKYFHEQMGVTDPIGKLSAGPIFFAHAGWAFVNISEESRPEPNENFYLLYDHPYSFEADAWLRAGRRSDVPVCTMNAGYSSGWCEESFGVKLVASEIQCRAKGDPACRFIMAPPQRIEGHLSNHLAPLRPGIKTAPTFDIPDFYLRDWAEQVEELAKDLNITTDELRRRDAVLEVIGTSATALLNASDPDPLFPDVMQRIGAAAGASRVHLYTVSLTDGGKALVSERHFWEAPGFAVPAARRSVQNEDMEAAGLGSWLPRLSRREIIAGKTRGFDAPVRAFLERADTLAVLVVPIFVRGDWWGVVAFDNCAMEREWSNPEIGALRILAELFGAAIGRAHEQKTLADANRIVENSSIILYRISPEAGLPLTYISSNIERYGYAAAELLASPGRYLQLMHPDDASPVMAEIQKLLDGKAERVHREFRWQKADGSYVWFEGQLTALPDKEGRPMDMEGLLFDIAGQKASRDRIIKLAMTDSLTGLPNRRRFLKQLRLAQSTTRRGARPFALHFLDLDLFKDINDSFGHIMGDALLRKVAGRLRKVVRSSDIVARLGGDEFAILETDVTDPPAAGALATKILEAMAAPYSIGKEKIYITTSIGISCSSTETGTPEDLMARADLALYRAKEEGRNCFRFHTKDLDEQVRNDVNISQELRPALRRGELEVVYQPIVEMVSGRMASLEALVRWNHPKLGLIMPAAFVPVAERSGAIVALGAWVFETACRQFRLWHDQGVAPAVLSVNVSKGQFMRGDAIEHDIARSLAKWGIGPDRIEIELTETDLMDVTQGHADALERLRKIGVRISIDDFGTGYSSLNYLTRFPANRLKIAQELVLGVLVEPRNATVVRAAIRLGGELDVEVVAEGVETREHADFLIAAGCELAQGYYFSKPLSAAHATELLRQGKIDILE